ncbi:hypothetical protein ES703_43796 [subsurface metagenome]
MSAAACSSSSKVLTVSRRCLRPRLCCSASSAISLSQSGALRIFSGVRSTLSSVFSSSRVLAILSITSFEVMPSPLNLTASLSKPALTLKCPRQQGTQAVATVSCLGAVSGSWVIVGVVFCSGRASFWTSGAAMVAANFSSALMLSRGGTKTFSKGILLMRLVAKLNQSIPHFSTFHR